MANCFRQTLNALGYVQPQGNAAFIDVILKVAAEWEDADPVEPETPNFHRESLRRLRPFITGTFAEAPIVSLLQSKADLRGN